MAIDETSGAIADLPADNWIKLRYEAGYDFAGFGPPNSNVHETYRQPFDGSPPDQEDHITAVT